MANQEKRILINERKKPMLKMWKWKSKHSCVMAKLSQIADSLSELEERLSDLEDKSEDKEVITLKDELQRKNRFIEDLLIKMLDGNFSVKREDSAIPMSSAVKDYLKKKADNGARKLP